MTVLSDAIAHLERYADYLVSIDDVEEYVEVDDCIKALRKTRHDGTYATSVSQAEVWHEREADDPLPVGRLRHSPYSRMDPAEKRAHAMRVLRDTTDWICPRFYCTAKYESKEASRYWTGVLLAAFRKLHDEGIVERRCANKRGARYEYRIRAEHRLKAVG